MKTFLFCCVTALTLVGSLTMTPIATANPEGGSISNVHRVAAFEVNKHTIVYRGGEQADFAVVGDGDTTLNVIVRDVNGVEITRTRGPGDRCHVRWTPNRTGVFYIYVINEGDVYNQYHWRAY